MLVVNYALGPNGVNTLSQHAFAGGVLIDPLKLSNDLIEAERIKWARMHGALMLVGFVLLMPLAIIASRHRWAFSSGTNTTTWFYTHMGLQIVSAALVVAGGWPCPALPCHAARCAHALELLPSSPTHASPQTLHGHPQLPARAAPQSPCC